MDVHGPDAILAEIALRQHGIVRFADLRAAGLSQSAISKRAARGVLHRIHRGVYAVGHAALSREAQFLATVFAAGAGAGLSRLAAAEHWAISRFRRAQITVVTPRKVRVAGVRAHTCAALRPEDVVVHRGVPVTSVAWTIVDLVDVRSAGQVTNVMHEAAFRGLLDLAAIEAVAARLEGRQRLGVLEDALAAYRAGSAGTKSGAEDAFAALTRGKLPQPLVNVKVCGEEVDAFWPEYRLIAEVDGPGHQRPRVRRRDRARDRILTAAGHTVLRFTDVEVAERPERVLTALRAAMHP